MNQAQSFVILGLSITSSWGNGHATVYRSLVRGLVRLGHRVTVLERDQPWYAQHRDLPNPPFARTELYSSLDDLKRRFTATVREADVVIVGSYVPQGVEVGRWVLSTARGLAAFYDIDTPITLRNLEAGESTYIDAELVRRYPLYLSFTGGRTLDRLEQQFGSPAARPLYCCFDPHLYYPETMAPRWDLGYMGTYSEDRQPGLESLLMSPASQWPQGDFVVAGPQYPPGIAWPTNVQRIEHLPPPEHRNFYNRQRFTLNLTRAAMIQAGWAPSVRLFEAAACGTAIISDWWEGLDEFFEIGREILVARHADDVLRLLHELPEEERVAIGLRARQKVLMHHTSTSRAQDLQRHVDEVRRRSERRRSTPQPTPASEPEPRRNEHADVLRQIEDLGPWFQNLHLPGGIQTAPRHALGDYPTTTWRTIEPMLPADLSGWDVLDIGCNAGFHSIELARRGARVLAIDHDLHSLSQARWAVDHLNLGQRIKLQPMQVYDLARLNRKFDLVLFINVFQHLRYPVLALDLVAERVARLMVFSTMTVREPGAGAVTVQADVQDVAPLGEPGWPKLAFIEHRLAGDPTHWWLPNASGTEAILRSAGLSVVQHVDAHTCICRPDAVESSAVRTWDRAELLSATGRPWGHLAGRPVLSTRWRPVAAGSVAR
jgi:methyltransferase (TIGR04290 family)